MAFFTHPPSVALAPRPWLTRIRGECAFPVDGEGLAVRSCCNPTFGAADVYCPAHAEIMRGPTPPPIDALEREILALLGDGR